MCFKIWRQRSGVIHLTWNSRNGHRLLCGGGEVTAFHLLQTARTKMGHAKWHSEGKWRTWCLSCRHAVTVGWQRGRGVMFFRWHMVFHSRTSRGEQLWLDSFQEPDPPRVSQPLPAASVHFCLKLSPFHQIYKKLVPKASNNAAKLPSKNINQTRSEISFKQHPTV